jgi:hypothetical protein
MSNIIVIDKRSGKKIEISTQSYFLFKERYTWVGYSDVPIVKQPEKIEIQLPAIEKVIIPNKLTASEKAKIKNQNK